MDLADIPAAAAFLRTAELSSASVAAESARSAAASPSASAAASAPPAAASRLIDHPEHSSPRAMDPNATAAAAALLGAAHFYPAAAAVSVGDAAGHAAAMAQQYYAQNFASFANVASGFMPLGAAGFMPMSMFGAAAGAPPAFRGGPPPVFLGAPGASAAAFLGAPPAPSAPPPLYDLDATALQNQLAAQFTQATPQQQTVYYEGIRQQLDVAAASLNDSQKQALLRMDPSLSFSMKPIDLEHRADVKHDDSAPDSPMTMVTPLSGGSGEGGGGGGGGVKRARTGSNAGGGGGKKKKKKSKASSCETSPGDGFGTGMLLLNEETPDGSSSSATTPRATPRGRPPGSKANAGVELTPSGKKKSMTPQAEEARARKAKMTWPKGTFLIRLQDVKVRTGKDHIWLVDNHQLLQRFNNEDGTVRADGSRIYHKTDRYTGWLCHEGFHYFPLFDGTHVLRQDGDTVTVLFPGEEDLRQAIDYQEQEKARRAEMRDSDEPEALPLPPSIRDQPTRFAQLMLQQQQLQQQQQQQLQLEYQEQARGSSSSHNMSMPTVPLLPYESATVPLLPYLVMKQEEPEKEEKYREGLEEGQLMMSPLRGDGVGPDMLMTSSSSMMMDEMPLAALTSMDGGRGGEGRGVVKSDFMGSGGLMTSSSSSMLDEPPLAMLTGGGGRGRGSRRRSQPVSLSGSASLTSSAASTPPVTTLRRSTRVKHEMPFLPREDHLPWEATSSSLRGGRAEKADDMGDLLLNGDILDNRMREEEDEAPPTLHEYLVDHTYSARPLP